MNKFLKNYSHWTKSMWFVYHDNEQYRHYAVMGMGLSGEAGEVADLILCNPYKSVPENSNYIKELGDILYYWGIINATEELNLEDELQWNGQKNHFPTHEVLIQHSFKLMVACSQVTEILKKKVRDNHLDRNKLKGALLVVLTEWLNLVSQSNLDWQKVIEHNMIKLEDRKARNVLSGSGDNR